MHTVYLVRIYVSQCLLYCLVHTLTRLTPIKRTAFVLVSVFIWSLRGVQETTTMHPAQVETIHPTPIHTGRHTPPAVVRRNAQVAPPILPATHARDLAVAPPEPQHGTGPVQGHLGGLTDHAIAIDDALEPEIAVDVPLLPAG